MNHLKYIRGQTGSGATASLVIIGVASAIVYVVSQATGVLQAESSLERAKSYLRIKGEETARIVEQAIGIGAIATNDCTAAREFSTAFTATSQFGIAKFTNKSGANPARVRFVLCRSEGDNRWEPKADDCGKDPAITFDVDLIRKHCEDKWADIKITANAPDRALFGVQSKGMPGNKLTVEMAARVNVLTDPPPGCVGLSCFPPDNGEPGTEEFCFGACDSGDPGNKANVLFIIDGSPSIVNDALALRQAFADIQADLAARPRADRLRVAAMSMLPADALSFERLQDRVAYKELNIYAPGFLKLVDRASIDAYKDKASPALKAMYPLDGCDKGWFAINANHPKGHTCFAAATQLNLHEGPVEAGTLVFQQMLEKQAAAGSKLFEPGVLASVVFVSDTNNPGLQEAAYANKINSLVANPNELIHKAHDLHGKDYLAGLKFHALSPNTGSSCTGAYSSTNGSLPLHSEPSQGLFKKPYHQYTQQSGGVHLDLCRKDTNRSSWRAFFDDLFKNSMKYEKFGNEILINLRAHAKHIKSLTVKSNGADVEVLPEHYWIDDRYSNIVHLDAHALHLKAEDKIEVVVDYE